LPVFLPVRLFGSAASRWFAPASGCIHASNPLRSLLACFAGCAACFRSPSGVFAPSGSKPPLASQPFGPPSGIARSSFAPRSLSIERFGHGSSFPIRYISGGSTLDSLYRPRIAPLSVLIDLCCPPICIGAQHLTLCFARRLLRVRLFALVVISDCSLFTTQSLCPVYGLLRTRHLAFRFARRLLRVRFFQLSAALGLLRVRQLTLNAGLRISPYVYTLRPVLCMDRSVLNTLSSAPLTDCSVCDTSTLFGSQIAPLSLRRALCCSRIAPCSTLRVSHRTCCTTRSVLLALPRARIAPGTRLGSVAACGYLRTQLSLPCANRESLRA